MGKGMRLDRIHRNKGTRKSPKRVGRGAGCGSGKTSGRGTKGQRSRSGGQIAPGFEGGQMPLQRRLPKRGFKNIFKKRYALIHVGDLKRFEKDSVIDPEILKRTGLIKKIYDGVKLLSNGEISHPLTIRVHKCSQKALQKIEALGGKIEVI